MSLSKKKKIQEYRDYLKEGTHLEFREVGYLAAGIFLRGYRERFDAELAAILDNNNLRPQPNVSVLHKLYLAIRDEEIKASPIKSWGIIKDQIAEDYPYFLEGSYEVWSDDAIAAIVTRGAILPVEMQAGYGIHQIIKPETSICKGLENKIKRYAVAQVFRWKYSHPKETISSLCRRVNQFNELGASGVKRLNFWPNSDYTYDKSGTGKRPREPFQQVKRANNGEIPLIPGVVEKQKGVFVFDFQLLKIVLDVVSGLILLDQERMTSNELQEHPLIRFYGEMGGRSVQKIVRFCLKKRLRELDRSKKRLKVSSKSSLNFNGFDSPKDYSSTKHIEDLMRSIFSNTSEIRMKVDPEKLIYSSMEIVKR